MSRLFYAGKNHCKLIFYHNFGLQWIVSQILFPDSFYDKNCYKNKTNKRHDYLCL
jgi:hypothetical protein